MNYIEQITQAIEASTKVVWVVWLASLAAIAAHYSFPDSFIGLPIWVMPSLRLVGIFSFVLVLGSSFRTVAAFVGKLWAYLVEPYKRRSIHSELLKLRITEVATLSLAIAESDRTIWIKPDSPRAISLRDKKLIRKRPISIITSDGTCSFEVPEDVWRIMLSLEEFRISDPARLLRVLRKDSGETEETMRSVLPQLHPSVQAQNKK